MTRSFLRQSRDSDVLVIRQKSRLVLDLHTTAQCTVHALVVMLWGLPCFRVLADEVCISICRCMKSAKSSISA